MADLKNWGQVPFTVTPDGGESFTIYVSGRDRWALEELIEAEAKGCTPIDNPAPRWSGYVHNLRSVGIVIETIHEKHGGQFPGTHARYVFRSEVFRVGSQGVAA